MRKGIGITTLLAFCCRSCYYTERAGQGPIVYFLLLKDVTVELEKINES